MKATQKLKTGDRVKITTGLEKDKQGTVQFNKGQDWYIDLDGETRPANIVGRKNYYTVQYKKHLELINK